MRAFRPATLLWVKVESKPPPRKPQSAVSTGIRLTARLPGVVPGLNGIVFHRRYEAGEVLPCGGADYPDPHLVLILCPGFAQQSNGAQGFFVDAGDQIGLPGDLIFPKLPNLNSSHAHGVALTLVSPEKSVNHPLSSGGRPAGIPKLVKPQTARKPSPAWTHHRNRTNSVYSRCIIRLGRGRF
jgi:hypothetical protein